METTRKQPKSNVGISTFILYTLGTLVICCTTPPPCTTITSPADFSEGKVETDCPSRATSTKYDLILKFRKGSGFNQKQSTLDKIIGKTKANAAVPCACDSNLFLITYPSNIGIDPEARLQSAENQVDQDQNGDPIANAYLNVNIDFNIPDGLFDYPKVDSSRLAKNSYANPKDVIVAVIDGGIDFLQIDAPQTNPWVNDGELGKLFDHDDDGNCYEDDIVGYDFTTRTGADPSNINRHGTLISKILTEELPKEINMHIMDLRVFDKDGNGNLFDGLCAIQYAFRNNVDLINISWGYYSSDLNAYSTSLDTLLAKSDSLFSEYVMLAERHDIPIVTSAGNKGLNTDECPHYPSSFSHTNFQNIGNVISVGATDFCCEFMPDYSNRGVLSIDIAAKGTHNVGGDIIEGTSFSAPEISRLLAILIAKKSAAETNLDMANQLLNNVNNMGFQIQTMGIPNHTVYNCQ